MSERIYVVTFPNEARAVYDEPREGAVEYERVKEKRMTHFIDGPLGLFQIPESAHPRTREVCEQLTRQVFGDATTPGEYEAPELPTFEPSVAFRRQPVVLDLGAGWGAFTCWAYAKWVGSVIHCYEPHDAAADVLMKNVASIPHGHVALHREAVTVLSDARLSGAEDWGSFHVLGPEDTCAIPVRGIHPRDMPRADILKIDVEGGEVEVLENYPHLSKCAALLVEYHDQAKRERVADIATGAGFRCVRTAPVEASYGVSIWVR